MRNILLVSTAAVLMSGSLANAGMLLFADEKDHKRAVNTWVDPTAEQRYAAGIAQISTSTFSMGAVSRGFLLHNSDNDSKQIENQYVR